MPEKKYEPTPGEIAAAESMMTDEQKAMSETREQELQHLEDKTTPEKEPKKTLYLVYRDNQLFQSHNQRIIDGLTIEGYRIIHQVFPAGTKPDEIANWTEDHITELQHGELLTDGTVANAISGRAYAKKEEEMKKLYEKLSPGHNLDYIMKGATNKVLLGDRLVDEYGKPNDYEKNMEIVGQAFVRLIRNIILDPDKVPDKVLIVEAFINDHEPFGYDPHGNKGNEKVDPQDAINHIRSWLAEAGIPEDKIEVLTKNQGFDEWYERTNSNKNWLIIDRHAVSNHVGPSGKSKVLELPISSFLESATKLGLVSQVNEEELKRAIEQEIKERFGTSS